MEARVPTALWLDAANLERLADGYARIDLTGRGPPPVPWGASPCTEAFEEILELGRPHLPPAYRGAYVDAIRPALPDLERLTRASGGDDPGETVLGAVYQHAPDSEVAAPLRRFLGVVADLYESFLGDERRAHLGLPLRSVLPALAMFRHDGSLGPYTFPSDVMSGLAGTSVGVVSLPSAYRLHPVLWGSLAHEVGGHDVLHADEGLLAELGEGVHRMFDSLPGLPPFLGALWRHWIDEAAADVYGVLNLGPHFILNLIPWLAALRVRWGQVRSPALLTTSSSGGGLDPHPTDILRIHLALGAIGSLRGLGVGSRVEYARVLARAAEVFARGRKVIALAGELPLDAKEKTSVRLEAELPLATMQNAAAAVGAYVATVRLRALGGLSIQDIETWDDADELMARRIAGALWVEASAEGLGDAAHALSGATLAVSADPARYGSVTSQLESSLDRALEHHRLWRPTRPRPAVPQAPPD